MVFKVSSKERRAVQDAAGFNIDVFKCVVSVRTKSGVEFVQSSNSASIHAEIELCTNPAWVGGVHAEFVLSSNSASISRRDRTLHELCILLTRRYNYAVSLHGGFNTQAAL